VRDPSTPQAAGGASWKQTTYLKQSNLNHNQDAFGSAIALSGDGRTLVVDAADEDGTVGGINGPQYDGEQIGDHSNGALFVFVNTNGTWSQQAYIKSSNIRVNDLFGIRLAVSRDGNVLAASSMLQGGGGRGVTANQQDFSGEESGAVYVFTRAGTTWTQRTYLKSPNSDAYDEFGSGVAMSGDGNTLAIAAQLEDSVAQGIDGKQEDDSAQEAGAVYFYTRTGTVWSQKHYVKSTNNKAFDEFGSSVALSRDGRTMAVGARGEDSSAKGLNGNQADNSMKEAGSVYVFAYNPTSSTQRGTK
jgi:hypothetical protein